MKKMLRIRLNAQTAHYRMPFMQFGLRQSYPIPPYSTAIGLLMNILGEQSIIDDFLGKDFGLFISGNFTSTSQEYVWYRNMTKTQHDKRPLEKGAVDARNEHIGGQSPVTLEVLNDVEATFYVLHEDRMLELLRERLYQPERWISHLSLGRSEDWATPQDCQVVDLVRPAQDNAKWTTGWNGYCWLPHPQEAYKLAEWNIGEDYQNVYHYHDGNALLITSLYKKVAANNATIRNFKHVRVKLATGAIAFVNFHLPQVLIDPQLDKPVFLARISQTEH